MPDIMTYEEILSRLDRKPREEDFPPAFRRAFWEKLPEKTKKTFIAEAENAAREPVPFLSALDYMKFVRTGNRIDYETPYFARRRLLARLALGEAAEYEGRFLDPLVEMVWQILAEPVWCLPAHQRLGEELLPGPEAWVVDLFASQTAKVLADLLRLLGPELEKTYAPLAARIRHEICRRALEPAEKLTDETCWWYKGTNNWSVWCCCSLCSAAIEVWEKDHGRLARFLHKHMIPCKRFFDKYPPDGGCNEGPCYWEVSVGMLMDALDMFQRRLGGFEAWFRDPKLKAMVEYLPRMNLCGAWFLNFSDAEARLSNPPLGKFLSYGRRTDCSAMVALAADFPEAEPDRTGQGIRTANAIDDTMAALTADFSDAPRRKSNAADFWPDLQIWIARQFPDAPETGLVCALKGGHNKQSHNHLDLGHFTLFDRNRPVIIDVGRGIYDRTCFSDARYTLWNLNSEGHNAPRFDGRDQGIGIEYDTRMTCDDGSAVCDLTRAYTKENGIISCVRKIRLDREKSIVTLSDAAAFAGKKRITVDFYSPEAPEDVGAETLVLGSVRLSCRGITVASAAPEPRADRKLAALWGPLWRITLRIEAENSASWEITFAEA